MVDARGWTLEKNTDGCRKRIEEAIGKSGEGVVRMQKQKDRIYFVVAQIVADGDQDVANESTANFDAKEGESKDNGYGDDNLQLADTTKNIEPN